MATRLYFPSTGSAGVAPAAWASGWNYQNGTVSTFPLLRSAGSSVATSLSLTNDATATARFGSRARWVSDPLAAQSISGTIKGQIRCSENSTSNNATIAVAIIVINSSGTTVATLLQPAASDNTAATPPELAAALTNRRFQDSAESASISLSSYSCSAGDRIVVELGFREVRSSGTESMSVHGAGSSGDLPEDDTQTSANYRPWIEFSGTLGWQLTQAASDGSTATDSNANAPSAARSDTATPTDSATKTAGVARGDSVTSSDSADKTVGIARTETLTPTDGTAKTVEVARSDVASGEDARAFTVGRLLEDTQTLADGLTPSRGKGQALDDAATSADGLKAEVQKSITDSVTAEDVMSKQPALSLSDLQEAIDGWAFVVGLLLTDSAVPADEEGATLDWALGLDDAAAPADEILTALRTGDVIVDDAVAASDDLTITTDWQRAFEDAAAAVDGMDAAVDHLRDAADALAAFDEVRPELTINIGLDDAAGALDELLELLHLHAWEQAVDDVTTLADGQAAGSEKALGDAAAVSDAQSREPGPGLADAFTVADALEFLRGSLLEDATAAVDDLELEHGIAHLLDLDDGASPTDADLEECATIPLPRGFATAFDHFDGDSLGPEWTTFAGALATGDGYLYGAELGVCAAYYNAVTFPHDQYARAVIVAATVEHLAMIYLHHHSDGRRDHYLVYTTNGMTEQRIEKVDGLASSTLWRSGDNVPGSGACVLFEVEGETLRVKRLWDDDTETVIVEMRFSGLTWGQPGLGFYSSVYPGGSGWDDFEAGSMEAPAGMIVDAERITLSLHTRADSEQKREVPAQVALKAERPEAVLAASKPDLIGLGSVSSIHVTVDVKTVRTEVNL